MDTFFNKMLKITETIPCYNELVYIINKELETGNILLDFQDVAMSMSETYYILLFEKYSKNSYANIEQVKGKYYDYDVLVLSDNNGAVEIRFNYERANF